MQEFLHIVHSKKLFRLLPLKILEPHDSQAVQKLNDGLSSMFKIFSRTGMLNMWLNCKIILFKWGSVINFKNMEGISFYTGSMTCI